ncbi:hypothetical protein [Streptantibioticus ferralitis]|uniref:Uncharacterized protein n=1 Tax=Streptantibioticus ferralitis TaxID=236510 RepID=A0ABT5Z7G8_9ACTN|nr:hypothetical protein [Streptantibioticus ferralitis]MDF2259758.1 hypothetical protein [Streptantibioticus ferralitis]
MHDPTSPSSNSPQPSPGGPADTGGYETAVETVGLVIAWYSRQILAERRSDTPDPERLEQLMAQQRACVQDQRRLEEAGPEEAARITAVYAARLKELEDSGPQS